jgi:hypothetical protein
VSRLGRRKVDAEVYEAIKLMARENPTWGAPKIHGELLQRWLLGTHQGAVSMIHLPYYLDEFTFRFNRRNSKSRGKLFYRLMQQAVATPPTTYPQMAAQTTFRKVLTGRNR